MIRPLISGTVLSDVAVCRAELAAIGVMRGLLDAREVEVVRRLDDLTASDTSLFPQDVVAKASKSSLMHAERLREGHTREGSIIDIGLGGFGLPVETIRRWACIGSITPVVVSADGIRLLLGRETRIANRAQRRALRVLYRTCALCDTPFDLCQIHHVNWFTLGGRTDINDLLPLCSKHHHLVHEGGWTLHLAPDRTLTITKPGHNISTHPPPNASAA